MYNHNRGEHMSNIKVSESSVFKVNEDGFAIIYISLDEIYESTNSVEDFEFRGYNISQLKDVDFWNLTDLELAMIFKKFNLTRKVQDS